MMILTNAMRAGLACALSSGCIYPVHGATRATVNALVRREMIVRVPGYRHPDASVSIGDWVQLTDKGVAYLKKHYGGSWYQRRMEVRHRDALIAADAAGVHVAGAVREMGRW